MGVLTRYFEKLVSRKVLIPVTFLVIMALCLMMLPLVTVNYDLAAYLPADAGTKRAIDVAKAEFDYPGTAQAMAKGVALSEALDLKARIKAVPGVKSVLWLDDVADTAQPLAFIPADTLKDYYKDGNALYQLEFDESDYSESTSKAIAVIRALDGRIVLAGNAVDSLSMKDVLAGEMFNIIAIVVPICILILMLASYSWLEPALYLTVIGVSVAINMGTNAFFGSVSFITNAMAAVLQLAVSMDYSIFLLHRYFEERDRGLGVREAVVKASVSSLASVSASALTTVAGFAALLFMRYGIGADIGLVLLKGVTISLVTVMTLMPVLLLLCSKALERTRHRLLMPSFGAIGRGVMKARFGIIAVALLAAVPALLAQGSNSYSYGDNSAASGQGRTYEERKQITDAFGAGNAVMLLVPKGDTSKEIQLAQTLEGDKNISSVTALATIADSAISRDLLPKAVVESFASEHYSRMIVYLNTDGETPESFAAVKSIRAAAEQYYPGGWYAAGRATSLTDIRDTVTVDNRIVTAVSLLAVGLIVLVTFRSVSLPLILLLVIELAVWVNMSVPYFTGFQMAYIGYLIISSLQLGSTIDYGILLSNRYREFRAMHPPREAAVQAVKASGPSVLTSALILATAGYGFGAVSSVDSISQLGSLIGRGALVSCLLAVTLLPSLLATLDKFINLTTLGKKQSKVIRNEEENSGTIA